MGDGTRTCLDCSADISARHRNARRCRSCARATDRARQSEQAPRSRPCAVDDEECTPGRLRRGHCPRHYGRLKTTGQTSRRPNRVTIGIEVREVREPVDRFSWYEVLDNGCWSWTGPMTWNGYGHGAPSMGDRMPHRAFYMHHIGGIPDGADIDHTCHNGDTSCAGGISCLHRRCVNPAHLEATSRSENVKRGRRGGTRCKRHDLSLPGAIRLGGGCTRCWRESYRAAGHRYRLRKRAAVIASDERATISASDHHSSASESDLALVTRTHVEMVDDLVGGDAAETVEFGLDGVTYEIDLNDVNAKHLRDALAEYVENGRKLTKTGKPLRKVPAGNRYSRETSRQQREWGRANGWPTLADRGRIPADVVEAWEKAHPTEQAA